MRPAKPSSAAWYHANGALVSAIDHAYAAGDLAGSMEIFTQTALRTHNDGNDTAVESWLARVDAPGLRVSKPSKMKSLQDPRT